MQLSRAHSLRTLVLVMIAVVITGVIIAYSYYGNLNRSVDPRIIKARELYSGYDGYARTGDFYRIFELLDSIEQIYLETEHYRGSFEIGVLENNRAAALLTIALYGDSIPQADNPFHTPEADSVAHLAMFHARKAIRTYDSWNLKFEGKTGQEIRDMIRAGFVEGFDPADPGQADRYLSNRVGEIETALRENNRRLSVCHTNLGVIYRYQGDYPKAIKQYEIALAFWDRNLEAENNLNRLLNKPIKKRNILQKIFPPNDNEN